MQWSVGRCWGWLGDNPMYEWFAGLPRWQKVAFALAVLGVSAGLQAIDWFSPWGWGVGIVLLIAAFSIDDD